DAGGEERVDQPIVKVEPLRVHRAGPLGDDARPGDAEAVRLEAERLHDRDVLFPAVVMVAGDVAALVLPDRARLLAAHAPARRALAVGGRRAFDLVRGGRRAPDEVLREFGGAWGGLGGAGSSHGSRIRGARGPAEKLASPDQHGAANVQRRPPTANPR